MKIAYLGTGSWGFCLANLLAKKGYRVTSWTLDEEVARQVNESGFHPRYPGVRRADTLWVTTHLEQALEGAEMIVEAVTAASLRKVCEQVKSIHCPFVVTSKGIEQGAGVILPETAVSVFGEEKRHLVGVISGPGYAQEVIRELPTSVVATAFDSTLAEQIQSAFNTSYFRVYPNHDIIGVSLAGALKNIIAIACGISEGLQFGHGARAALITRGLHEIRKLSVAMGARSDTLSGLAGMGDLTLTCSTPMSRNFHFGELLAKGSSAQEAKERVGMVVEGAYSCVAALQLSRRHGVSMPLTELVHQIIYENLEPAKAVARIMSRAVKEEHL